MHTLQDIYYAEQQIAKNLPDMIEKASDLGLKNGFQTHLSETKGQITRLEKVFEMHGVEAKGVDCPAIDGILKEASEVAGDIDEKQVLDAALIAAAQAVEHYEITRYGTLIAWAKMLARRWPYSLVRGWPVVVWSSTFPSLLSFAALSSFFFADSSLSPGVAHCEPALRSPLTWASSAEFC
ncbi:ferritin-like metal-binding protein YciE [Bradyrhizobium japonicum]|nr:ferritin-like metal-binding protein YciE [Bradyrhizobium japonicum]BAL09593.1 hypothetical protein BJ6T_43200 [Bradyrhizobium japonicum USDA 6]MCS3991834.1 ferritin-like metal-binding protein YciE [Bradyrhizobium japonicum]MCS4013356.1 ferritin-like metal-binding protein YciE [Bradyrhizobium japonicum]MCS4209364.1 ferritin-like metal-binding protein YciE [Bradyrhizobium japonicum]